VSYEHVLPVVNTSASCLSNLVQEEDKILFQMREDAAEVAELDFWMTGDQHQYKDEHLDYAKASALLAGIRPEESSSNRHRKSAAAAALTAVGAALFGWWLRSSNHP